MATRKRASTPTEFPDGVPPGMQRILRSLAEGYAGANGRAPATGAKRAAGARRIQKKAAELLDLVQAWHKANPSAAGDDLPREMAEAALLSQRSLILPVTGALDTFEPIGLDVDAYGARAARRFDDGEIALARAGFDPRSLDHVLLGLQLHMHFAMQVYPSKAGAPRKSTARELVRTAAHLFKRVGLKIERAGRDGAPSLFSEACTTMFAIAGIVGLKGETLDPDDLIREVLGNNAPRKSLDSSP